MGIELYCPNCSHRFASAPETPALEILDRMFEDGPWFGLGDGETFEDMIFHALTEQGENLAVAEDVACREHCATDHAKSIPAAPAAISWLTDRRVDRVSQRDVARISGE